MVITLTSFEAICLLLMAVEVYLLWKNTKKK